MHAAQTALLAAAATLLLAVTAAGAQTRTILPTPSRTAFKCTVAGKVTYSDAPCPDAQRVELQPTRGLDSSTGRAQVGADVRNERGREQLAEVAKPITGMTPAQFEVARRRVYLSGAAKAECANLDRSQPVLERAAGTAPKGPQSDQASRELLGARQRYRALGC